MSKRSGKKISLPSEAQWEYACRTGSKSLYFFGDDVEGLTDYANIRDASFRRATGLDRGINANDMYVFTSPVGMFKANKYGLCDMLGNAWQWCEDYDVKYDNVERKKDPVQLEKTTSELSILRGGSWHDVPEHCRAAYRNLALRGYIKSNGGFRVVFR